MIALYAWDKPGALQIRKDNRAEHLAYVERTGVVVFGGPLLDEAGDMCGSLVVLDLPDLDVARAWAEADPYARAGLFEKVELKGFKKVFG